MNNQAKMVLGLIVGIAVGATGVLLAIGTGPDDALSDPAPQARRYFAQQAEDVIIASIFKSLMVERPTYLDIGAFDPVVDNNTYLLYAGGSHGVLVEPNPSLRGRLEQARPRDTVLGIGIGVTDQSAADYYVFSDFAQLNTFSKEVADRRIAEHGPQVLAQVLKIALVDINQVMAQHFGSAPDLLSVDVEGLDLEILKSLDFEKHRPQVICVETLIPGTRKQNLEIAAFLEGKGYAVLGRTFVNSIFVDQRRL